MTTAAQDAKLRDATVTRYIAELNLAQLPRTCGFTLRATGDRDQLIADSEVALMTAVRNSKLLMSAYQLDVVLACQRQVAAELKSSIMTAPWRPDLRIDQLAYHALRAVVHAQSAVDELTDELSQR